jgi:hypothetical protein
MTEFHNRTNMLSLIGKTIKDVKIVLGDRTSNYIFYDEFGEVLFMIGTDQSLYDKDGMYMTDDNIKMTGLYCKD